MNWNDHLAQFNLKNRGISMQARDDREATIHTSQGDWQLKKEGEEISLQPPQGKRQQMSQDEFRRFSEAVTSMSEGSAASGQSGGSHSERRSS